MKKILDNKVQVDTILLQPAEIFIILVTLKGQDDFNQMVITQFINLQEVEKILDHKRIKGHHPSTSSGDTQRAR